MKIILAGMMHIYGIWVPVDGFIFEMESMEVCEKTAEEYNQALTEDGILDRFWLCAEVPPTEVLSNE